MSEAFIWMWAALEEEATTLEREEGGRKERDEDAMESMLRTCVEDVCWRVDVCLARAI